MSKNIIVSNRLPVQIVLENEKLAVFPSVGGLATGMKSVHADGDGIWIGWSGLEETQLTQKNKENVEKALLKEKCIPVPLTQDNIDDFYLGFSNKTLWPLFHYFTEYTSFENSQWLSYKEVNEKFAKVVLDNSEDGDTIWIHDYQLLLLPELVKEHRPNSKIGFFLHIPYPSFEIFRIFPWREQLLKGMLGADLIGFHTYDYERHFLSSVKRILRLEVNFNQIIYDDRVIKVDSFPMGIDYDKFYNASKLKNENTQAEKSDLQIRLEEHHKSASGTKLILSIDRLDYTKGIPNRIKAFEYFLNQYPEYKEKVRLIMLAVPSRSNVPQYKRLKRETDELVGRINGKFSTVNWTPIWYFYRSFPFENLIDLYTSSDVALITPLRDGMNLVAKEYVATRTNQDGVLILSEMAGASKEMNEAIIINPNNFEQFSNAIKQALEMSEEEQNSRMKILQKRLKRYNVEKWASEFMKSLSNTNKNQKTVQATFFSKNEKENEIKKFKKAKNRLILLDYDGTLSSFKDNPKEASPDNELYELLDKISSQKNTTLSLISGRDKETFHNWFPNKKYTLITDHGVWLKKPEQEWEELAILKNEWMESILPVLENFADNTPGTFVEKKEYSLAWHYRKADPELAETRTLEVNTVLSSLIANHDLSILNGNKVIEIKNSSVNKGKASTHLLINTDYDYILAIGDDYTDEFMFEELPDYATTIKVGFQKTKAKYYIKDTEKVRAFLIELF
ncbi:bifunctional alpha,alpha-trehalose-phosphate synthase (UDP-forming)/trehalose-phosphatase [Flavobacterium jejuense]|uniref:Alpha,alpha-trehalose-phosphate synthase n=1 Tax=Flavobacterium jejuense TaxID=1544455 RepID=A0ABX0IPP9_9FLAO|nr:bifunctional alpha,alpha-trehalose-phosphate synthase (UDP-forming)/trehalose-phosphatase [Flavobacterium jejuense]NHN25673.1 bifunctional alpha,alpha-trehalose-phosphate synthase (UDP-forming)/trehalose-phosphatase [Flavobacterium jejuense]